VHLPCEDGSVESAVQHRVVVQKATVPHGMLLKQKQQLHEQLSVHRGKGRSQDRDGQHWSSISITAHAGSSLPQHYSQVVQVTAET